MYTCISAQETIAVTEALAIRWLCVFEAKHYWAIFPGQWRSEERGICLNRRSPPFTYRSAYRSGVLHCSDEEGTVMRWTVGWHVDGHNWMASLHKCNLNSPALFDEVKLYCSCLISNRKQSFQPCAEIWCFMLWCSNRTTALIHCNRWYIVTFRSNLGFRECLNVTLEQTLRTQAVLGANWLYVIWIS